MRPASGHRPAWTAVVVLLIAAVLAVDVLGGTAGQRPAPAAPSPALHLAADTSQFRAGNIISDDLFFDGNAMSAGAVQEFLRVKGASCTAGAMPCLKDFRENTWNRADDAYCNGYAGAPGETAAWIIAKVGQSCGISQRVILVLLQKEQSLVRATEPSARQYQKATGYACPDTAPCDAQYFGFYNQVWNAARRFKVYAANPQSYNYRAGRVNSILFNPDSSCGRSDVYIENQATAGLYVYTPYQPNAAALAAGYGGAPPCGAYGNRNFWLYYTDWFGSTQSPGGNAVVARAMSSSDQLGPATSGVVCGLAQDGCFQAFAHGSVYWSARTGAHIVRGAIGQHWAELRWELGALGYPTRDESCGLPAGGCFQEFQHGAIYWSPGTGAQQLLGAIRARWNAQGWEGGPLGYPTADEVCGLRNAGCFQAFQGGTIYWSAASGARIVTGQQLAKWGSQGWETGALGYPTGDTTCGLRDGGCYQHFQGGSIHSSRTTGTWITKGAFKTRWQASGWERGVLGYPTSDQRCGLPDGGCYQTFQGGSVYSSASTSAFVVRGVQRERWAAQRYERGPLGYPTGDTTCGLPDGGCYQTFQGGSIYSSASTGAHVVAGRVRTRWAAQGYERGPLGYPTAEVVCGLARGGCSQAFQGGVVVHPGTTAARAVTGRFLSRWTTESAQDGALGYPTGDQTCGLRDGGCFQHFEGGSIYTSTSTGIRTVMGPIRDAWRSQGWELGHLGYPTADRVCGLRGDGCSQRFQGGVVAWSPATGGRPVIGGILGAWNAGGAQDGPLGYPTGSEVCGLVRGGCFQTFQNGSMYWSPATGAHRVGGAILTAWGDAGWERGALGYPEGDPVVTATEIRQVFEGGTLVQNRSTGRVTRR